MILVRGYDALGLEQLRDDARRVLAINYPMAGDDLSGKYRETGR
jgi:hypothetical protein